jgi:FkbM family methyltransferase
MSSLIDRFKVDVTEERGHHFISRNIGREAIILDLGANQGEFAERIYSRFGVHCISVEANAALCKAWKRPNGVIHAAIAAHDGEMDFFISENTESSSIFKQCNTGVKSQIRVRTLTLQTLMRRADITHVDLVKMDIEGAEIEVLSNASDETLMSLRQISVEFHDFALPEVTPVDVARVKERLHALGFWSVSFSRRATDVLFINRRAELLSQHEYLWLTHVVRHLLGAGRAVNRLVHSMANGLHQPNRPA